jgi:hypothetical protein
MSIVKTGGRGSAKSGALMGLLRNLMVGSSHPALMAGQVPSGRKGSYGRRIIKTYTLDGYEYQYHATKGWRVRRAA